MPDNRYLSIGEVLGLLLEDFPDVTISKIRFLESQGLIEPERTPSGYRKFYDHDVDLLRAILHEQRENFLPLKVIRDRIESGGIQTDSTGARTPPRGIRNVDTNGAAARAVASRAAPAREATSGEPDRDSVFRRTDGGPEWADGRALIPGAFNSASPAAPVTMSVPVVSAMPANPTVDIAALTEAPASVIPVPPVEPVAVETTPAPPEPTAVAQEPVPSVQPVSSPEPVAAPADKQALALVHHAPVSTRTPVTAPAAAGMPLDRDELCAAAGITVEDLAQLESFGLVAGRGTGRDVTYTADALAIAAIAGRFLANGIDARHLRTWRQAADREAALFEQRIMPLLRQRNPQSRQAALDTLTQLADLGGQLRGALVDSALRHHFEGS
ncbi:MAG: putative MerR family transcriptional regulator [Acidimicrobiales bacterium]|nr:putative MerR family transcriptional regulator [Acidimicrobiales bacterium]